MNEAVVEICSRDTAISELQQACMQLGKLQWKIGKILDGIDIAIQRKLGDYADYYSFNHFCEKHEDDLHVSKQTLYTCLKIYRKVPEDLFEKYGVVASYKLARLPKRRREEAIFKLREGEIEIDDIHQFHKKMIERPEERRLIVFSRVDQEVFDYIQNRAEAEDRSLSYITRKILEAGLSTIDWKTLETGGNK